ncbi:hypothetical protein [Streptomyces exfoliatus]|uniref:hypothetical protein n=1 Tax=Streptomyces exfoliatus TaxID=1905 RepID=UPI0012FE8E15|nr:hypothetical protein [Streptomyces exfoliatus]
MSVLRPAKQVLKPARGSAAVETPLVETPVDVRFKAWRGVKAHGLASVQGDERAPARHQVSVTPCTSGTGS